MTTRLVIIFLTISISVAGQTPFHAFDPRHWGVVLDHADIKKVSVKKDVAYFQDETITLTIDICTPPGLKNGETRPAVIFLNAFGDTPGQPKLKDWGIYESWPRLVAAHGLIGISMDTDRNHVQESFRYLFEFIEKEGARHQINSQQLGVYAASANVNASAAYLMSTEAFSGIKAAVLYYGAPPQAPFRKDLPVLFYIAEGDLGRTSYATLWSDVLRNNAPWTITMGSGLPHGFDAFEDTDQARMAVKETISFWKNKLEPVQQPSWQRELPREVMSAQYMHDYNKAAELTKKWLVDHPADQEAMYVLSQSLKNANRFEEAEPLFQTQVSNEPTNADALIDLAQVLYGLNKNEEAEKYFLQAEKVGPIHRFKYTSTSLMLYNQKKYLESAAYLEKALALEPRGVDFYNLACNYALAHENDKAFDRLAKAVENGFRSKEQLERDTDLASLRSDKRWLLLTKKLE